MVTISKHVGSRRSSYVAGEMTIFPDLPDPLSEKPKFLEVHGKIKNNGHHIRQDDKLGSKRKAARVAKFFELMRSRGDGQVQVAWARYFEINCDGKLRFREFCKGLSKLGFTLDSVALWQDLAGDNSKFISVHTIDTISTEVVEYFQKWCSDAMGGPFELVTSMVAKSLEPCIDKISEIDFLDGLESLGFFQTVSRPDQLATPELVRANLLRWIDRNSRGMIAAKDVLFLEKDKQKRERHRREIALVERFGREEADKRMLPKNADRFLNATLRWTCDDWQKAYLPAFRHCLNNEVRSNRPSSAPPGAQRRSSAFSSGARHHLRRPASASARSKF